MITIETGNSSWYCTNCKADRGLCSRVVMGAQCIHKECSFISEDDNENMLTTMCTRICRPGRVAQSVGHLTHKSGILGSIPRLATYFRFSFRFFKKGSCQLLAKVCARSTG